MAKPPTPTPPQAGQTISAAEVAKLQAVASAARRLLRFGIPIVGQRHIDAEDVEKLDRAVTDLDGKPPAGAADPAQEADWSFPEGSKGRTAGDLATPGFEAPEAKEEKP